MHLRFFGNIFQRIVFDVLPDFIVVRLIADSVVVKGFLPHGSAELPGNPPFHRTNYRRHRRGGYYPPADLAIVMNRKSHHLYPNDGRAANGRPYEINQTVR